MKPRVNFLISLIAFTVVVRMLPYVLTSYDYRIDSTVLFYPWNFVPLMACCLYAGAYVADRRLSLAIPVLTLLMSDLGIWAITGQFSWAFPSDRWSAYLCYLIAVFMGTGLNQKSWPLRGLDALGRGILAEVMFFVVTNAAYFYGQSDLPHDVIGLLTCYVDGIPFAIKSFASTAFFSVLIFSPLASQNAVTSSRTGSPIQPALAE